MALLIQRLYGKKKYSKNNTIVMLIQMLGQMLIFVEKINVWRTSPPFLGRHFQNNHQKIF